MIGIVEVLAWAGLVAVLRHLAGAALGIALHTLGVTP